MTDEMMDCGVIAVGVLVLRVAALAVAMFCVLCVGFCSDGEVGVRLTFEA